MTVLAPDREPAPITEPVCGACPHPETDHDAIALRFCGATLAAALVRGCVCRAG